MDALFFHLGIAEFLGHISMELGRSLFLIMAVQAGLLIGNKQTILNRKLPVFHNLHALVFASGTMVGLALHIGQEIALGAVRVVRLFLGHLQVLRQLLEIGFRLLARLLCVLRLLLALLLAFVVVRFEQAPLPCTMAPGPVITSRCAMSPSTGVLMLSSNNILLPSNGRPVAAPSQDMVMGNYYLTVAPYPAPEKPA